MSLYIKSDEILALKEKFKKYNLIWQRYAPSNKIGNCAYLFDKLNPVSPDDFLDKYLMDGTDSNNPDPTYKGRTEYQLINLAHSFYNDIKDEYPSDDITLSECLKIIIIHAIYETYNGHIYEYKIKQLFIKNKNTLLYKPSYLLDTKLGIDYVAYNSGFSFAEQQFNTIAVDPDNLCLTISLNGDTIVIKPSYSLQIKPLSFFIGNRNPSLIKDRLEAFNKDKTIFEQFHLTNYYIIYDPKQSDNDNLCIVKTNDGHKAFKLNKLINPSNGHPYLIPTDRNYYKI